MYVKKRKTNRKKIITSSKTKIQVEFFFNHKKMYMTFFKFIYCYNPKHRFFNKVVVIDLIEITLSHIDAIDFEKIISKENPQ